MTTHQFFISELTSLRHEAGLSRAELGQFAGIAPENIRSWEEGRTCPNLKSFIAWAEALGYELDLHRKESNDAITKHLSNKSPRYLGYGKSNTPARDTTD